MSSGLPIIGSIPTNASFAASSELIGVEPQAFDQLVYLAQNCDRVVSKDDLIASPWNIVFVFGQLRRDGEEDRPPRRLRMAACLLGERWEDISAFPRIYRHRALRGGLARLKTPLKGAAACGDEARLPLVLRNEGQVS